MRAWRTRHVPRHYITHTTNSAVMAYVARVEWWWCTGHVLSDDDARGTCLVMMVHMARIEWWWWCTWHEWWWWCTWHVSYNDGARGTYRV